MTTGIKKEFITFTGIESALKTFTEMVIIKAG